MTLTAEESNVLRVPIAQFNRRICQPNMSPSSSTEQAKTLGQLLYQARIERGLNAHALGQPEFTERYVLAVERDSVQPSQKAIELFAGRLGVPVSDFMSAWQPDIATPDLEVVKENQLHQANYAKMLIRMGSVAEALDLVDTAEATSHLYFDVLPSSEHYLWPFLRGRAHLQQGKPEQACKELERALELNHGNDEAEARIRNLLGAVFYELEQPSLALEHHSWCLEAIHRGVITDLNFLVSVFRNLANDYWARGQPARAIKVYKEALTASEDLDDKERQAGILWGLVTAYNQLGDRANARLYAVRALDIYEMLGKGVRRLRFAFILRRPCWMTSGMLRLVSILIRLGNS